MREYIVETKNLKKYYQMGANTVKALDGVDFRVKDQEFVAIIGKSGSGKSTLLHMLGGLDVPTEGEVLVEGKCLLGLKKEQLAIFRRRKIGFIFQNYNLVPDLNVYENVILPVELDGRKVDVEYVDGILELLGLAEKREALPGTLSGGQQQRAAIARALAAKPAIILADEPTGNLDSVTSHDVLGLLKMAARQFSQTLILITHDRDIAQLADRIVHIEDGKCEHFSVTGASISRHLAILKDAELIRSRREGKFIYYELNTSVLEDVMLWLTDLKGVSDHEGND